MRNARENTTDGARLTTDGSRVEQVPMRGILRTVVNIVPIVKQHSEE